MNYTTISISDTRLQLPDLTERVSKLGEIFAIEKWGKIKAYLVPNLVEVKLIDSETALLIKRKKTTKKYAGMWKDRIEMKDSVKWVSDLRKKESSRYGKIFN